MGPRDHPSLSKDALPSSWDSDRPAGRPLHHREAGQEQAEAHHPRDGREAGQRPEGCEIRGVLRPHTGTRPRSHMTPTVLTEILIKKVEERGTPPSSSVHAAAPSPSAWLLFIWNSQCLL